MPISQLNTLFIGGRQNGLRLDIPELRPRLCFPFSEITLWDFTDANIPPVAPEPKMEYYRLETLAAGDTLIYIYVEHSMTAADMMRALVTNYPPKLRA